MFEIKVPMAIATSAPLAKHDEPSLEHQSVPQLSGI